MENTPHTVEELRKALDSRSNEINKWLEYFRGIDTRSALVISAERINFHLEEVLEKHHQKNGNLTYIIPEELALRAKNAYKLNLIPESIYQIITQIRKIRNIVAHTFIKIEYEDDSFKDCFRIITLNIKKEESWFFQLMMYRKIFYDAAIDKKVNFSLEKLESIFEEFIYEDRAQFLEKVLIHIILELGQYNIHELIVNVDKNELIQEAQREYDDLKNDLLSQIQNIE